MSEIRMPTQKRSIEKRNKIIEKGFELICQEGYHNISTPDIAKAANVSTGIIYQYFIDKKDIFIEGVKNYANNILYPMSIILEDTNIDYNDIEDLFSKLIDAFIKNHTISIKAHEELMAMSHLDSDIAEIFKNLELSITSSISNALQKHNIIIQNSDEKIHIIFGLIENFSHEVVYHHHSELNYEIMKKEILQIITYILK